MILCSNCPANQLSPLAHIHAPQLFNQWFVAARANELLEEVLARYDLSLTAKYKGEEAGAALKSLMAGPAVLKAVCV